MPIIVRFITSTLPKRHNMVKYHFVVSIKLLYNVSLLSSKEHTLAAINIIWRL